MDTYKQTLEKVYSQVAPEVNELYEYFRNKKGLEEEKNTEKQLEILINKMYISGTYSSDLMLIVDYYERKMMNEYISALENYKYRIKMFLDN